MLPLLPSMSAGVAKLPILFLAFVSVQKAFASLGVIFQIILFIEAKPNYNSRS